MKRKITLSILTLMVIFTGFSTISNAAVFGNYKDTNLAQGAYENGKNTNVSLFNE